jgi:hypothetical protein
MPAAIRRTGKKGPEFITPCVAQRVDTVEKLVAISVLSAIPVLEITTGE